MTFYDWLVESTNRIARDPSLSSVRASGREFWRGAIRKTLEPRVGSSIWAEEWDVLVVIDAARIDAMREVAPAYDWIGRARPRWSVASCSVDWIARELGQQPEDRRQSVGYVTGNPFTDRENPRMPGLPLHAEEIGHLDRVYLDSFGPTDAGVRGVPPDAITDAAIDAWRRRDELGIDRLIVHYMQPHQPFRSRPEWWGERTNLENLFREDVDRGGRCVWQDTRRGIHDEQETWNAYIDNFYWALDSVSDLRRNIFAPQFVVTSDHGNGMGEWGTWAHPPGTLSPAVRQVPWVETVATRKEDRSVPEREPPTPDSDDVTDRLKDLGYV